MAFQILLLMCKQTNKQNKLIFWSCWCSVCLTSLGLWRSSQFGFAVRNWLKWTLALCCVQLVILAQVNCPGELLVSRSSQFFCLRIQFKEHQKNICLCSTAQCAYRHNSEFNDLFLTMCVFSDYCCDVYLLSLFPSKFCLLPSFYFSYALQNSLTDSVSLTKMDFKNVISFFKIYFQLPCKMKILIKNIVGSVIASFIYHIYPIMKSVALYVKTCTSVIYVETSKSGKRVCFEYFEFN